jgi:hypothetical protein
VKFFNEKKVSLKKKFESTKIGRNTLSFVLLIPEKIFKDTEDQSPGHSLRAGHMGKKP